TSSCCSRHTLPHPPSTPLFPYTTLFRSDREFTSSFESGDPAPDWLNSVETAPGGGKRAKGVDGAYSSGIPGNVTDRVTGVRASAENTGGGEVKENLVDGEPTTKWLTFESTGW